MQKLYVYAGDFWAPVVSGENWLLTEENNLIFNNGNVGIGTDFDLPSALLHVNGTGTGEGNVLFTGLWNGTPGPAPALGGGTRLFWYPDKAAFRAGRVTGTQWNTENIGNYSSASGYNSIASGWYSNAWGNSTTASGNSSTAFGENTTAPSFAETVIGYNNTAYTPASATAWVAGDRLFVIGNGSGGSSDALVMLKNGNTGLGISNPLYRLHANGSIYASNIDWAIRGVKTGAGSFPGVWGETESSSADASGVRGYVLSTTPGSGSAGVYGRNYGTNNSGAGIKGTHDGGGNGVQGETQSGIGVYGRNYGTNNSGAGIKGTHDGGGNGVQGETQSGIGVYGVASGTTGTNYGVYGQSSSEDGYGLYGINTEQNGIAIYGQTTNISGHTIGVLGRIESLGGYAIRAESESSSGVAIALWAENNNPNGFAGYFDNKVFIGGDLTVSGSKSFVIDHPHDPANKYLYHYCIESPEPYNIYRGNVLLDETGKARVSLPGYFDAINTDFSYHLTPIGAPMPDLHIASAIGSNTFEIGGGAPGKQVSWQVTASRNDAWVRDKGVVTEVEKTGIEKGTYLYPQGYGQGEDMSRSYRLSQMNRQPDDSR
jgi:hypothetical protein